jgi:hypothetical protein
MATPINTPAFLASLATLEAVANQPGLSPVFATALKREVVRRRSDAEERARYSGVRQAGMEPPAPRPVDVAQVAADAEAAEERRLRYLASSLGKARAKIAESCRAAEHLHARLNDVGSALSRGDSSANRKAEDCAETLRELRLLVADMEAFVRLHQAEEAA